MRRTTLLLIALAGLALATPLAQAQQTASLTLDARAPDELAKDEATRIEGVAVYIADYTAMTSMNGVPVEYHVVAVPEWATVTISPATDVFPLPQTPGGGASFSSARTFTITVVPSGEAQGDLNGLLEIAAVTTPGPLGRSTEARLTMPLVLREAAEACPEHEALAPEAAPAAQDEHLLEASADAEGGEVTVQQAGATPVSVPWMVVAAFGLVGAGVGIVLRQRLRRA